MAVGARCNGASVGEVSRWLLEWGVTSFLSPAERSFLRNPRPAKSESDELSWRAEALAALLWALGDIPSIEPLNIQVDFEKSAKAPLFSETPETFLAQVALRPAEVLEVTEEFLYNQHWRVRDAELFNKPMPRELDPLIVYQRRYALSWLVGRGEDWDIVPSDT